MQNLRMQIGQESQKVQSCEEEQKITGAFHAPKNERPGNQCLAFRFYCRSASGGRKAYSPRLIAWLIFRHIIFS